MDQNEEDSEYDAVQMEVFLTDERHGMARVKYLHREFASSKGKVSSASSPHDFAMLWVEKRLRDGFLHCVDDLRRERALDSRRPEDDWGSVEKAATELGVEEHLHTIHGLGTTYWKLPRDESCQCRQQEWDVYPLFDKWRRLFERQP